MLPLGLAFAGLDGFNGLSFGKRWQQSPLVGGAIDELRVFAAQLSPFEVSFCTSGAAALERDGAASVLIGAFAALDAGSRRRQSRARRPRARELNRLLTSLPEVMTMGDTHASAPSYVLTRGVYRTTASR